MSIKKLCGTIAVVLTFCGFSTAAFACPDREVLAGDIVDLAMELRCLNYPSNGIEGTWDATNAVWQFKPKRGGDGCEVHYKLSKLLDELAQDKQNDKGKPNNKNRGAASALRDGKDQGAFDLLQGFIDTILYHARVNPNYVGTTEFPTAASAAQYFVGHALSIQNEVGDLLVCQ